MKKILIAMLLWSPLVFADWRADYQHSLTEVENVYASLGSRLRFSQQVKDTLVERARTLLKEDSHPTTAAGRPLVYYRLGRGPVRVIWIGGVHADEFVPGLASWRLLMDYLENPSFEPGDHSIIFIPFLNYDGWIDGHARTGYPTRNNGVDSDINRSFYSRKNLPNHKSQNENEFVLDLMEKYAPEYWVAPHAALDLLDIDGEKLDHHMEWWRSIGEQTTHDGGPAIPLKDFRVYAPPGSYKNWSLGKLAEDWRSITGLPAPGSLTWEFSGPGERPTPGSPDYNRQISRRKHLGRYEDNTHLADQYYDWYSWSLRFSVEFLPERETPLLSHQQF